ncbi:MAG: hypothetical protein JRD89_01100 [Deltaproteobacteria bacterium]|nr:hypothetical protein [Deltaproteobacteria bacterium]
MIREKLTSLTRRQKPEVPLSWVIGLDNIEVLADPDAPSIYIKKHPDLGRRIKLAVSALLFILFIGNAVNALLFVTPLYAKLSSLLLSAPTALIVGDYLRLLRRRGTRGEK